MMSEGTLIQIRRCGTTAPIETLMIGDLVYDPILDNYNEIADMLSCQPDPQAGLIFTIAANSLSIGRPSSDLTVSRQQMLLAPPKGAARRRVEETTAGDVGHPAPGVHRLHLIVLERDAFVMANGTCLRVLGELFLERDFLVMDKPQTGVLLPFVSRGGRAK